MTNHHSPHKTRDLLIATALANGYTVMVGAPDQGEVDLMLTNESDQRLDITLTTTPTGYLEFTQARSENDTIYTLDLTLQKIGPHRPAQSLSELLRAGVHAGQPLVLSGQGQTTSRSGAVIDTKEGPHGSTIYTGRYAPGRCQGCGVPILDGYQGQVTVASRGHLRTVESHDGAQCREQAHQNTVNDPTWVRGPHGRDY